MSVTLRSFIRHICRSIFSLIIVVVLAACGSGDGDDGAPTVAITPAAGGMVMPTTAAPPTATATETVVRLTPGQLLVAINVVRLYADASRQAIVMNQYGATSVFTVLEPSGEYLAYPVIEEGTDWIRLRADDGLVGWLPANELTTNE